MRRFRLPAVAAIAAVTLIPAALGPRDASLQPILESEVIDAIHQGEDGPAGIVSRVPHLVASHVALQGAMLRLSGLVAVLVALLAVTPSVRRTSRIRLRPTPSIPVVGSSRSTRGPPVVV